jgi:hypothetical protein
MDVNSGGSFHSDTDVSFFGGFLNGVLYIMRLLFCPILCPFVFCMDLFTSDGTEDDKIDMDIENKDTGGLLRPTVKIPSPPPNISPALQTRKILTFSQSSSESNNSSNRIITHSSNAKDDQPIKEKLDSKIPVKTDNVLSDTDEATVETTLSSEKIAQHRGIVRTSSQRSSVSSISTYEGNTAPLPVLYEANSGDQDERSIKSDKKLNEVSSNIPANLGEQHPNINGDDSDKSGVNAANNLKPFQNTPTQPNLSSNDEEQLLISEDNCDLLKNSFSVMNNSLEHSPYIDPNNAKYSK